MTAPLPYTGRQLVDVALAEVGYREGARNASKYGAALGMDHAPWCALFVEWCARQAGGSLVDHLGIAWSLRGWTPAWAIAGRDTGRLVTPADAGPGDLVLFDFPDTVHRVQHIGVVVRRRGRELLTVEGNTSFGVTGSQTNGEGVFQRVRSFEHVVCIVRPLYASQSAPPAPPAPSVQPPAVRPPAARPTPGEPTVQLIDLRSVTTRRDSWQTGPTIAPMQRLIGTPDDGVAGPQTKRQLGRVQGRAGVDVDYVFGPATATALLAGK